VSNTYIKLIEAVELDKIFISSVNSERYPNTEFKDNIKTVVRVSQKLEFKSEDKFIALTNFNVNAHDEFDENKQLFKIDCNFLLEYRITQDLKNTIGEPELSQAIEEFIKRNVPINAWPYGREFISQMTTRMGLPPLVIGTYKYIPANDKEE
jgi:preprotein translocase subunit SecB